MMDMLHHYLLTTVKKNTGKFLVGSATLQPGI